MHKTTARAQLALAYGAATRSRKNDHLDASAFKGGVELERDRLTAEKRILEAELSELNARITRAKSHARDGKYTKASTFGRWQVERADLARRVAELDAKVRELNNELRSAIRAQGISFERAFVVMARRLLAEAVVDKVTTAALHMMSEDELRQPTTSS